MDAGELYKRLYELDVNGRTESKNGLTYLSWAWAWAEFKKICPEATYEVQHFNGLPYVYDKNTGYMVFTSVKACGLTHSMWLPVMDGANKAMKSHPYEYSTRYGQKTVEAATMFDINKAIMRCLTKNLSMFGLGLYIYAGEDLPEELPKEYRCTDCGALFEDRKGKNGKMYTAGQWYHIFEKMNTDGVARCWDCMMKAGTKVEPKPKTEKDDTETSEKESVENV